MTTTAGVQVHRLDGRMPWEQSGSSVIVWTQRPLLASPESAVILPFEEFFNKKSPNNASQHNQTRTISSVSAYVPAVFFPQFVVFCLAVLHQTLLP